MFRLESLLDETCGGTTVAKVALAHAGESHGFRVVGGQPFGRPLSSAVGDPTLFAAGWSDPNSGMSVRMRDPESPSSFQIGDVPISDYVRAKGVHDYEVVIPKNKLGSKPDQVGNQQKSDANHQVEPASKWVNSSLEQKQAAKAQGNRTPHKVAFRLERFTFTHTPIFTGISANGKGK